jgi:hypothetical protein
MAHPYYHALASASEWGGIPTDYLPVHQWFDRSKEFLAGFRHRALRHHAEGIETAGRVFGTHIINADGETVSVKDLGRQHVLDDLGRIPSMREWFTSVPPPESRDRRISSESQAAYTATKWGGSPADYLPLHQFLDDKVCGDWPDNYVARHHSEGVFLLEGVFGDILENCEGSAVPVRGIGESHVNRELGRIPSVTDILRAIRPETWMMRVARPSRVILREVAMKERVR